MNIVKAQNLACPIDGGPLACRDKQLVCEHGHAFDIARQGYVNLLPVQHKRSKQPGDSKEMVAARTRFLNSGVYAPVADRLAEMTGALVAEDDASCLLDAGCGEGYYLDAVSRYLGDSRNARDVSFIGLDISKPAIAEAARRNKQLTWLVGTNRQPPVMPGSIDIILCVFGFQSFDGFSNVLKTGGRVILAEPGPDHLKELRAIIYPEVRKSGPPDLSPAEAVGFTLRDEQRLQFRTGAIDREHINNLLVMTPHLYRATQAGRAAAGRLRALDSSVDVVFRVLEKT